MERTLLGEQSWRVSITGQDYMIRFNPFLYTQHGARPAARYETERHLQTVLSEIDSSRCDARAVVHDLYLCCTPSAAWTMPSASEWICDWRLCNEVTRQVLDAARAGTITVVVQESRGLKPAALRQPEPVVDTTEAEPCSCADNQQVDETTVANTTITESSAPARVDLLVEDYMYQAVAGAELSSVSSRANAVSVEDGLVGITVGGGVYEASLSAYATTYALTVGTIEPIDSAIGVATRLFNLGYLVDVASDDLEGIDGRLAVELLQADVGVEMTGIVDDATRAALQTMYGC